MFLRMLHNDMCIGASTCNALLHYKVSVGVLAIKMSSRLSGGSSCVISLLSTVVFDITWGDLEREDWRGLVESGGGTGG